MTLSPASPPPIEALSPDLQYKLWERDRNRLKRSWIFALLLCSPAIAFIAFKPINDTLTTVYRGAAFLHWLTGLATLPQAGSGAATVPAGTAGLNAEQTAVAQEIIQAGIDRGLDQADIRLALMTAMQESTMQELEHGDDWHFQAMGWGERSDSVGAFQQRDSWGSRECRIDAKCSANLFYDALLQVPDRHSMPEWKAIATVQRPAAQYEQHYQQWAEKADKILKAVEAAPSSPIASGRTVPFKGIIVTSAKDASGEPGLDYVVSNGDRGAEIGALVAGTVVETVTTENWESHLEAGDTRRGYGNLVVVRVTDEVSGEEVDMLYAHFDSVAVSVGQQVGIGTVLGTQGRSGSTTAPHSSVDFFAPGTRSPNAASLAMRDRIAGILQNNPESLNAQIPAAQPVPPQLPPISEIVSLAKTELPKDLSLPVPQAAATSTPSSFISVRSPNGLPCSGFAVAPDRVATALHCISNPAAVTVIDQAGNWLAGQQIASAEDAAIVSIPGANFTPAQLGDAPAPGAVLTSWGHPHGANTIQSAQIEITSTSGNVFLAAQAGDRRVVDGFSGGPVFDADGKVIGLNSEANPDTGAVKVQAIGVVKGLLIQ